MPYADFDIDEIVAYGKERGVMLIGHHETYANVENYEEQLEDAYDYYQSCKAIVKTAKRKETRIYSPRAT